MPSASLSRTTSSVFLVITLVGAALAAPPARAAAADVYTLRTKLSRESALIAQIRPYVERQDLPALLVLESATNNVKEGLQINGPAHMSTLQGFQELVISSRFSKNLFSQARTVRTASQLEELQKIGQELAQSTGFDDNPYTRITASVYSQVTALSKKLLEIDIPAPLRKSLEDMKPLLGRLLAQAAEGDHSRTFAAAEEVQRKYATLYPLFDQVAGSDAAYLLVLELQGLNEYYAQFARFEDSRK
jgi:hypothetical protein